MRSACLFINGKLPKKLPDLNGFDAIFCTDGALNHLLSQNITPHTVVGDFDSIQPNAVPKNIEKLYTPNQDFTDFHKALDIICERGFHEIEIWGGSGNEHDHFLGNLTTAFQFKDKLLLTFFDTYSKFFFCDKNLKLTNVQNKMISLYPFPEAKNVVTLGLHYPLQQETLNLQNRIGTRNFAAEATVEISYEEGALLVFVSHEDYPAADFTF